MPEDGFGYALDMKEDHRGALAELFKATTFGQIFVSRTKPGATRGNHYHDTKTEKFCVLEGDAVFRFRHIEGEELITYRISGRDFRVMDIPPGYTHSIENVGDTDMVVLFWASEPFDPQKPDTHPLEVIHEKA
jgi:UDP-2-acetamido-2,6-beta-L-arabino-hexul-4-ose reductase